jgi:hypothetical protein
VNEQERTALATDGANQYHLWCYMDENYRRPFGFHERVVTDSATFYGIKQRRFAEPADA